MLAITALIAAWLSPNHYPPWTSFHGEAAAFAALCLFGIARLLRPEPVVIGRVPLFLFSLLLLVAIQWAAGQIPYGGDALVSGLYVAGFAIAWWLGHNSPAPSAEKDALMWLAAMVVAAAIISVLIGVLQWLRMESVLGVLAAERGPGARAYANLGQPNHFASLMLMGVAFALLLFQRGALRRWQLAALVTWLSLGLVMSESRSALLGAAAMGLLVLWKAREVRRLPARRLVVAWWLMLVLLATAWSPVNEFLYLQPPREHTLTADRSRQVMWRQSVAGIVKSPWVGYGWRQSMVGQKAGAEKVEGWLATDYAHNIVLDLMLWLGIPLGLLLAATGLWWVVRSAIRLRGEEQLFLLLGAAPLLVHSLFEFPFAYSYFLFPAGWLLGTLGRLQQSSSGLISPARAGRYTAAAAVFCLAVLGAAVASEYFEVEEDYRVMRFELRRVGRRPQGYEAPDLKLLTQMREMLSLGRLVPKPGMPAADIDRLRVATRAFGWATLHLSYVLALGLNGNPAEATHQLSLLRAIYGPEAYEQSVGFFRAEQAANPELRAVKIP